MSYFTKFKSGGAFLTFFILWLFSSSAWAQEVTAEQSVFTAVNSTNLGGDPNVYYETAKGGGTTAPAINNGEIRLYQNSSGTGGGTITISAVEGLELVSVEIGSSMATSIAYTLNGSTDKSETESLAADGTFLVSDINAQSVTFYCMGMDKSSRLYVNYLKATYKPIVSTQVIKPVLSPEDGTNFTESLTVTASCATEGATIYYTTNGDIPTTGSYVIIRFSRKRFDHHRNHDHQGHGDKWRVGKQRSGGSHLYKSIRTRSSRGGFELKRVWQWNNYNRSKGRCYNLKF